MLTSTLPNCGIAPSNPMIALLMVDLGGRHRRLDAVHHDGHLADERADVADGTRVSCSELFNPTGTPDFSAAGDCGSFGSITARIR